MFSGKIVGDIHINVCVTEEGNTFYYLNADNKNVVPVLDYITKMLSRY